ncbi:MAG: FHA domain-containing protein [Anaerolineales bacterium]|jgi:pSer/pThr/pTyr-binding forkhead associated (FHA) protein
MSAYVLLALRIIMAAALYGFIAWALYTLWKDLKNQEKTVSITQTPELTLIKLGLEEVEKNSFQQSEIILGRDPSSNLRIDDITISAQHALLSFHQAQWWIKDLESTNGTFLNNERIFDEQVVTSGDVLKLGNFSFEIHIQEK